MENRNGIMKLFSLWCLLIVSGCEAAYYGKSLGKLSEFHHGVSGHVYSVDGRTLFIKDFTYDGEGPAAYFYVGTSKSPSNTGATRLRDERGSTGVLKRYRGKDITLTLPEGKTFHSIKWFSIWCDEFSVNFGDVKIPRNVDFPKPQKISGLAGVHGVSSDPIVIVDAQTLLIPNFSYDGEAPDAKFWMGRGDKPSPQGIKIPDENGKITPLRRYDHKTIVLTLPEDLTVFDIGHFGVWCEAFTVDFGHVTIPPVTNVPPSLKMLGVSPQSKLNCEVLYDDLAFEVRWAVAGESVVIQLVAKLEDSEYMSFGLSGHNNHTQMVGADVAVAWVDKGTLKGYAYDYYLDAKSQCAGTRGSCPDERLAEKTNSVRLLNAAMVNGYSIVTYQRPLKSSDELDKAVHPDRPQPIVWAVGPLNSKKEVSYHTHFLKEDKFLDFGRPPAWNCPMPEMDEGMALDDSLDKRRPSLVNGQYLVETSGSPVQDRFEEDNYNRDSVSASQKEQPIRRTRPVPVPTPKPVSRSNAWEIPPINCYEPEDGVFYAQMGPTGGKQGYPAITGHVGWGISWYINGLLIPEINVVRGKTYTFVVEGGFDPSIPAKYHPFYITDDSVGGFEHQTADEKANVNIYAGVRQTRSGDIIPTGVGRLCNWTPDTNGPGADEYSSFGAYQRSLTLKCDPGEPGVVVWTPDANTPDTVYYQCFTHRYLGWKINVLDACENAGVASEVHETYVPADADSLEDEDDSDLVSRPSIRVATRIKPDTNFLEQHKKELNAKLNKKTSLPLISDPPRVNIREIATSEDNKTEKDELKISLEYDDDQNPKVNNVKQIPTIEIPFSNSQLKLVIDAVENTESKNKHISNDEDDKFPVYQHTTVPSDNTDLGKLPGDMIMIDSKHAESLHGGNVNQKPMTLQTFMRPPQGKPNLPNNVFFRRPMPMDMRNRRPMPKPILGMPMRIPPPYMVPQQNIFPQKKVFHKMPVMHRPPINSFGRPPLNLPIKTMINNPQFGKPVFGGPPGLNFPNQPIILGKPSLMSQTLTLGQPTIIGNQGKPSIVGNQVVKSQMSLPGGVDSANQQTSSVNSYLNKPGQIIMGKPMDNPIPLDQQMIPTKQHFSYTSLHPGVTTIKTVMSASRNEDIHPIYESATRGAPPGDITPSELLSSSISPDESLITMKPAVNTGFKPDSVVVEGGFKPIIREPLLAAGDRITDYDSDSVMTNRRSDAEDTESTEENTNQLLNNDIYEKQFTESFEPMFIPSPPDRHISKFLNESEQEMKYPEYVEIDRRPIYVFPETSNKENQKVSDDMAMAADRVDAYYLPPNHKSKPVYRQPEGIEPPLGTVISYDGKTVSDASLTSPTKNLGSKKYSSKLSSNSELLTKTPQFGPFKGEFPQGQAGQQVTKLEVIDDDSFPSLESLFPNSVKGTNSKATHLTLVNSFEGDEDEDGDLRPEGSEKIENISENTDKKVGKRVKRAAHHTPDHTDPPEHDHSHRDHLHDHSQHDHAKQNSTEKSTKSAANLFYNSFQCFISLTLSCLLLRLL